jgi:hypothetical protein
MDFQTKDSGERIEFPSGAKRDIVGDKPQYSLIPLKPLKRIAELYGRGATKYDPFNFRKGIPDSRCFDSAWRHLMQWAIGEKDEDHLAAVVWNCLTIMDNEELNPQCQDMDAIRGIPGQLRMDI